MLGIVFQGLHPSPQQDRKHYSKQNAPYQGDKGH